jgi:hypothetical protein
MSPAPKGKPKLRKRLDRPSVLEAARNYLRRGWTPVPLPDGAKGPKQKGWPELCQQITKANAADHFDNVFGNIGVKLGADSDGLIDVDLDCKEACRLAPYILPPTLTYGRPSKPRSHWLYKSQRLHTLVERATLQFTDLDGSMLVELRVGGGGKAAQTMVPPSFHPSGELVAWTAGETEPFPVENDADFLTGIKIFAAAILLARH